MLRLWCGKKQHYELIILYEALFVQPRFCANLHVHDLIMSPSSSTAAWLDYRGAWHAGDFAYLHMLELEGAFHQHDRIRKLPTSKLHDLVLLCSLTKQRLFATLNICRHAFAR